MRAHVDDVTLAADAPCVDVRRFASTVVITIPTRASASASASRRLERTLDETIGKSFDRLRAGIANSAKKAPTSAKSA